MVEEENSGGRRWLGRDESKKGKGMMTTFMFFVLGFVLLQWCGVVLLVWVLDKMLIFGGFGGGDVRERRKGFFFQVSSFTSLNWGFLGFWGEEVSKGWILWEGEGPGRRRGRLVLLPWLHSMY